MNTSIVAGCAGATTMLRAMLLQACDEVVGECPRVRLKFVVDDISLQALGSPSSVVNQIGRSTNLLVSRLETELGGHVSCKKSVVLASSIELENAVRQNLCSELSGTKLTKNLGVDYSCRSRATQVTQQWRICTVAKRAGTYQFLKKTSWQQCQADENRGPASSHLWRLGAQRE